MRAAACVLHMASCEISIQSLVIRVRVVCRYDTPNTRLYTSSASDNDWMAKTCVGQESYRYLARPFRSIWAGEIPWFRIFRVRYITRLLLCYRSRRKIDALQDALNRSEFQMLASGSCAIALAETETLQKAVGLVKQITESRLKIEAIVALGPILTIFSLATQKLILPIVHDVTDYLLDKVGLSAFAVSALQNKQMVQNVLVFFVLVFLYAIWLIASAWMDGRSILTKLGVHQLVVRTQRMVP